MGRLSKEEIEKMVNDAEKFKTDYEAHAYQAKSTLDEENIKKALSEEDRKKVTEKCDEIISWLDHNQTAEKDEFEDKKKELDSVVHPIMAKFYQAGGDSAGGPTIEEVD